MDRITSYLKMMRISDWIKFYTFFPVIGAFVASGISPNLILVCAIFICVISYGFVINNYFDVEIDQKHKKKVELGTNPLACNRVTKKGTLLLSAVLVVVPALLSATMDTFGFLFTLLSILVLTLYSAKPVRLKDRFLVDIISHGVMFGGFPFLAGFTLAGGNVVLSLQYPVVIASLCTIVCCEALIVHQIHDYGEDLGNSYTTVVRTGRKMGWTLLAGSMLFSLVGLELVVHYFGIGGYLHLGIIALLGIYPLYSCRHDVVVQAKSMYNKVLVPYL
ncbi:MAG: hypothetical protein STSR0009_20600 [Methanoregula sp.]